MTLTDPTSPPRREVSHTHQTKLLAELERTVAGGEPMTEQRIVWLEDNEVGECLQVVREGERFWFIETDMESGAAWHVLAAVDWPKSGEPEPAFYTGDKLDALILSTVRADDEREEGR